MEASSNFSFLPIESLTDRIFGFSAYFKFEIAFRFSLRENSETCSCVCIDKITVKLTRWDFCLG